MTLQALQMLAQPDAMGSQLLLQQSVVCNLISLISSQHITAVMQWPPSAAGGTPGALSLISLVATVLHMPFLHPGATDAFLKEVQEVSCSNKVSMLQLPILNLTCVSPLGEVICAVTHNSTSQVCCVRS